MCVCVEILEGFFKLFFCYLEMASSFIHFFFLWWWWWQQFFLTSVCGGWFDCGLPLWIQHTHTQTHEHYEDCCIVAMK